MSKIYNDYTYVVLTNKKTRDMLDKYLPSLDKVPLSAVLDTALQNALGDSFIGMSDTPATYAGSGGMHVRVNAGATALEFSAGGVFPGVDGTSIGYNGITGLCEIMAGGVLATMLQSAAADLGAANVNINLGNTNGAFVTNLETDGQITATAGFVGALTGNADTATTAGAVTNGIYNTDVGTVTAVMLQNAPADLGAADVNVNLSNTNGAFNTHLTTDGNITSTLGFIGDYLGDVTGNITGDITGTITGDITNTITGDITGTVTDLSGTVTDVSGTVTDVSGTVTDVSGTVTDVSGTVTDISGTVTDISGTVTDISGTVTDISGTVTDVSGTVSGDITGNVGGDITGTITGIVTAFGLSGAIGDAGGVLDPVGFRRLLVGAGATGQINTIVSSTALNPTGELIIFATAGVQINHGVGANMVNLAGAGNFPMIAGNTLHLVFDGTQYNEIARKV